MAIFLTPKMCCQTPDVSHEKYRVCATCDAAPGRWAKLLGVHGLLDLTLTLQDFLLIYNMSREFLTATDKE